MLVRRKSKTNSLESAFPSQMNMMISPGPRYLQDGTKGRQSLAHCLIRLAAFQNPELYQAQAMRLSTFGKPRIISCCEDFPKHLGLPRGCLDELLELFQSLKVKVTLADQRFAGTPLELEFHGNLRAEQQQAADTLLQHETGVLSASTAFGKTVVAAYLIAQRKVNTLVVVHRR